MTTNNQNTHKNLVNTAHQSKNKIHKKEKKAEISYRSTIRFWMMGVLFCLLGYRFYQSLDMVYVIISALTISISIEGFILSLSKKLKSRGWAIWISYFMLLLFVFSGIIFVIPFLISQLSMLFSWTSNFIIQIKNFVLSNTWPGAINQITWLPEILRNYLIEHRSEINWSNSEFQSSLLVGLNTLLEYSTSYLKQFSSGIFNALGSVFSVITNIVLVFTLAIFFSLEKEYLVKLLLKPSSPKTRPQAEAKIQNIYHKLSLWLKARVILSLFILITTYLSFWIMQLLGLSIPNMLTLSLLTGLLDIVPYIWPIFAMIPIIILVWIHNGFRGMLIVGAVYGTLQWIQNNIISPVLMERELGVNPILLLVAALLGAVIMGFWGIILSVPLAVIVELFLDEEKDRVKTNEMDNTDINPRA